MKKIYIFLMVLGTLFAGVKANIKTTILDTKEDYAIIKPTDALIGSSGVVIHYFDESHSTIVAGAKLVSKNKIKFFVFDALKQGALPTPNILPKKGDEVILNFLYDRGVIIASNFKTYEYIKNRHKDIEWLHPDLFATELSKEKNPAPTKKDFKNFCNKYAVGVVYIALNKRGYFVDCQTFSKIKKEDISIFSKETKLPFYSRLKEIETSWLNFYKSSEIENYDKYYKKLLELK